MNRQPDKLFRDKLHGYQSPASAQAWNRISVNLQKKNNRVLWLKIAASVLLIAAGGILIFPFDAGLPGKVAVEKSNTPAKAERLSVQEIPALKPGHPEKRTASAKDAKKTPTARVTDIANIKTKDTAHDRVKLSPEQPPVGIADESLNTGVNTLVMTDHDSGDPANGSTPITKRQGERVTIIFSADEVNQKYLDKNAIVEATSKGKGPSALKKLVDKAFDLKHNQDPLGDLREKKNEILAFNFKNEKQRNENQ
jgi:hypothetical protein